LKKRLKRVFLKSEKCKMRIREHLLSVCLSIIRQQRRAVGLLLSAVTANPPHVLMLSIQAVRGLPRLPAPGIVPCIISFSSAID